MKKLIPVILLTLLFSSQAIGQSFDWNIRGGMNIMNSKTEGKDISLLYHFGAQAGVRITKFGIYGEFLYSMQENQAGIEANPAVAYLNCSLLGKGYLFKSFFVEFGGTYMTMIGDPDDPSELNPDKSLMAFGGLGVHFSKIEISLRAGKKQEYVIIQATAAIKF